MDTTCIRTNIVLDKQLLNAALQSTSIKTRRELIASSLGEALTFKQGLTDAQVFLCVPTTCRISQEAHFN
jgi:hypothetical protein